MKNIKWKSLIISSLVCLLPILLGIAFWNDLPTEMAIHFNIYNKPDNYASKEFFVFAFPFIIAFAQIFCCITLDISSHRHKEHKKAETLTKWIIPVIAFLLQIITIGYNLGWNIDIRKSAALIIGFIFLVLGSTLSGLDYVKNYNIKPEKARRINRFTGIETVIMGVLSLVTIFLPPIATLIWIFLLIPYSVISIIYTIKVIKE